MNLNRWFLVVPLVLAGFLAFHPGDYYINFATRILIASVFAMGLNLLVGYGGLMSIGHGAFAGIAGYAVALLTVKYGWGAGTAIAAALLLATGVSAVFGVLALRAQGIGFLMITLAMSQIVWGLAMRWVGLTGGDSGLRGIRRPPFEAFDLGSATGFYVLTCVVFVGVCLLMWCLVRSPFGASLRGARDQPRRMSALGFNVWLIRWLAFTLAGAVAGVAGVLDAYHHKFISPEVMSLSASAQALLMVIVGGSSVLLGPVVGAVVVLVFGQIVSAYTDRWNTALGAMFVLIVLFMPDGLVPGMRRLIAAVRERVAP